MGLTLNIRKIKVLCQPGLALRSTPPIIKVHVKACENIDHFQYLGSVLLAKAVIDEEIRYRLQCASTAFGLLRKRVFDDNNIGSDTKIMDNKVVVVPALPYNSEMWTVYSKHLQALEQYHLCCLRKILLIHWEERCTNTSILDQAKIPCIKALTMLDQLQWVGHIVCLTYMKLPKQVLYPQLRKSKQVPGGQKKCFSDTLKASLAKCGIPTDSWELLAQHYAKWR
eukprot:g44802.t1